MLDEGPQDLVIELVVDAAAIDGFCHDRLYGVPRNLVGTDVRRLPLVRNAVHPSIDDVSGADLVCIAELVLLAPTDGEVSEPLQNHSMQEGQQEVQPTPLDRLPVGLFRREGLCERPLKRSLDATWWLKDVDTRQADQIRGNLGVELHGQEKAEVLVRIHTVELLLELCEPFDGQMDVLEHHPRAGLGASNDGLVRNCEALL
mmetsp:Transcript_40043/g.100533  ORF Transcript_40043/g.100533 Transcript_40043/m.100533 type:complete len:202 (-) Transcript_40043:3768-4373(-)